MYFQHSAPSGMTFFLCNLIKGIFIQIYKRLVTLFDTVHVISSRGKSSCTDHFIQLQFNVVRHNVSVSNRLMDTLLHVCSSQFVAPLRDMSVSFG